MNLGFFRNKEIKNAGWLIGGKVFQMIIALIVNLFTARYLGPGNYGVINYASAYLAFFTSLCTLGINSIIIKDFVDHPNEEGCAIGSTLVLRAISSTLSAITIVAIVSIVDMGEPITIIIAGLCSLALPFQIFDTFNYWFQSKYNSKVTSIVTLIAYVVTAIYKSLLLIFGKSVQWFAAATALDYLCVSLLLIIAYKKYKGPKLSFSFEKAKSLLKQGYHYILSGLMVAIYGYTDKFMLKQMLNETAVGYYSAATSICAMWVFVLQAIIDSMYPTIMLLSGKSEEEFEKKNRQLYAIVFYISLFVALLFQVFGEIAVNILYGDAYMEAVNPLRIVTWYTAFSYLGVARNAWIVSKNKQTYLKFIYMIAALMNIILNLIFIPLFGASGAALASLITQILTSLGLPYCFKDLRANAKLMLQAILLKDVFSKNLKNKENIK